MSNRSARAIRWKTVSCVTSGGSQAVRMIRAQLLEHTVGGNGRAWIVQSLLHLLAEHGVERRFFPIEGA
ncbi:hypothetical protein A5481_23120 [Methylobacterium platani]|uniref:Uncharacterized protein n=1 Tax=Methylobacterium platani TaxID=427683 RepID=A0A179S675_9HYPH|nr:hypothetical protein A5481_23120 [Methylobacterium platani]